MQSKSANLFCIFAFAIILLPGAAAAIDEMDTTAIIAKVRETYQNMTGYSSKGEIITEMDMSNVDTSQLPGMPKDADGKDSPLMKSAFLEKQTLKHNFGMKLSRQGDYRIHWEQNINDTIKINGVAWSKDGKYKMKISSPMMQQPEMEQKDRMMALAAATGVSGGAAHTIPALFYNMDNEMLISMQSIEKFEDETIDDKECYVLSGGLMGQTMVLWIEKSSFIIVQRKQIIGENPMLGKMSDEDIKAGLEATNQETTPEAIENFKKQMKSMAALSSKLKGFILEKHTDIQLNPELQPEDFEPDAQSK